VALISTTLWQAAPGRRGPRTLTNNEEALIVLYVFLRKLPRFGVSHRTSKLNIFDHSTLKTVHKWAPDGFDGCFHFFYLQFSSYNLKWSLTIARSSDLGDLCGHVFIMKLYIWEFFILLLLEFLYYSCVIV
jgi:hypothetical protein